MSDQDGLGRQPASLPNALMQQASVAAVSQTGPCALKFPPKPNTLGRLGELGGGWGAQETAR